MLNRKIKITLIRSERKTLSLQVKNGEIIARAPLKMKEKDIYAFVEEKAEWLQKQLDIYNEKQKAFENVVPMTEKELKALTAKTRKIISQRVEFYAPKIGVTYNKIAVRRQRTRWGSCSSKGNLNFNCLLGLLPLEVIDSVVVHELCHRKHMNHSPAFYKEIERVFPDYKKHHLWLKDNGEIYLALLGEK